MRIIKDIYWPEKMKLYFEQTMRATPSQFRNIASGSLVREIEDKTRERNGTEVEEQDLLNAFLDTIPVYFRGDMIKLLSDLGINTNRSKTDKIPVNDIVEMKEAIYKAVDLSGVNCDNQILDSIIKAYEVSLSNIRTNIVLGTTTRKVEHRGLTVHFSDVFNQLNPYKIAVDNHLLPNNGMAVDKYIDEVLTNVPVLGYLVEFNVAVGIESIGIMCASHLPQKLEKMATLKNSPESLKVNCPILENRGIRYASIYGVNYLKGTTWVYCMGNQISGYPCEWVQSLLEDFDYKIPTKTILELCLNANSITIEFSYVKNQPDSITFQMCVNSFDEIPKNLNNFIESFGKNLKFRSEKKKYLYAITFTKNGQYLHLKGDYSGTMVDCLTGPFSQKPSEDGK